MIGQVPTDFFPKLKNRLSILVNLQEFSMQGPGFNIMGPPDIDIGKMVRSFVTSFKENNGGDFYWSDNRSGLLMSTEATNERIRSLTLLNPDIKRMRGAVVTSFWATAAKPEQFEGQFGDMNGYKYNEHTIELLKMLL